VFLDYCILPLSSHYRGSLKRQRPLEREKLAHNGCCLCDGDSGENNS
jgi:hypothetical protein